MEWEEKIPSRLNRLRIIRSSHLTGQVGQAGFTRLRLISRSAKRLSTGQAMPRRAGLTALVKYAALFFEI